MSDDPNTSFESETTTTGSDEVTLKDATSGLINESDSMEHKMPTYVLTTELLPDLYDPAIQFISNRKTETWGTVDSELSESFIYDDPDFMKWPTEDKNRAISYSEYQNYILQGGKSLKVSHIVYNGAYLPFRTMKAESIMDQRESEVSRNYDFHKMEVNSAFEKPFVKQAVKEIVIMNFDGYVYSFYKIVSYDDREKYTIKIEKYASEELDAKKKLILSPTEIPNFKSNEFEALKKVLEERKESSRKRVREVV